MNIVSGYIKGHFIVNLINRKNSNEEKRVFYICHHDEKGAMGFVVNQMLDHVKFSEILDWSDHPAPSYEDHAHRELPVFWGGSQEPNRGFILHSLDSILEQTMPITETCGLTINLDFLKKGSEIQMPRHSFLLLGHMNWAAGELEKDLMKKSWVPIASSYHSLFEIPGKDKWEHLTSQLPYPKLYKSHTFISL